MICPPANPAANVERNVLAGLAYGCPIDGLHDRMFSDVTGRSVFRVIREHLIDTGAAPGGALLRLLVSKTPDIPELYREDCNWLAAQIARELEFPGEPLGARHFPESSRHLKELHRKGAAVRFVDTLRDRIEAGEDLRELGLIRLQDAWDEDPQDDLPKPLSEGLRTFTSLNETILEGIGRRGEVVNLTSSSKEGKTWLLHGMAISLAAGVDWMGRRVAKPRNALLIDNELHESTLVWRLRTVAEAMGLQERDYAERLHYKAVRGKGVNVGHLWRFARQIRNWRPDWVGLDSLYRFLPNGTDENANGAMKDVFEQIIAFSDDLDAMVTAVVHSSKGDQTGKAVTDVGSGAGSISRAADSHIVLRPHREDGCTVMEGRVRSFEQPKPIVLRWGFPLWKPDEDLDPSELRSPKQLAQDAKDMAAARELADHAQRLHQDGKRPTQSALMRASGWRRERVQRLLSVAQTNDLVRRVEDGDETLFIPPTLEVPDEF